MLEDFGDQNNIGKMSYLYKTSVILSHGLVGITVCHTCTPVNFPVHTS